MCASRASRARPSCTCSSGAACTPRRRRRVPAGPWSPRTCWRPWACRRSWRWARCASRSGRRRPRPTSISPSRSSPPPWPSSGDEAGVSSSSAAPGRVLVAMSGGVDSSVAAGLLRDEGWEVVGVTMRLWGGESDTGCCSGRDGDAPRRVAQQLGIDHLVFNFSEDFAAHVVAPYVADHVAGRTPNPCVECNRHLKFDRLLQRAERLGFDANTTGHHALVETLPSQLGAGLCVARGADPAKDQSYVLSMLSQDQLGRLRFPVGMMTKAEV